MKTFCPFLKDTCRGNECMMFRNEECIFVAFLQNYFEDSSETEMLETNELTPNQEIDVPDWLETITSEEIAENILEFKNKRYPEEEFLGIHSVIRMYWDEKGIEEYQMPSEIQSKIYRANTFAQIMIRKEKKKLKDEKLEKENSELPSLVGRCVDWAKANGLKRLTVADVDAYILERKLDILNETRRAIYAKANVELKCAR